MEISNGVKQIICVGNACRDIFFPTDEGKIIETPEDLTSKIQFSFELGAKYKVEERYETLGGCSANVASGLARLGINVACYSHIGDDYSSQWIKELLEKNGVGISLITQEKNCPSDLSAIIVDKNSGERTIFSNQKTNGKMEIIPDKIQEAFGYFIGDLHGDWERKLDIIFEEAAKNEIKVAFNPRQTNIHDNAKKIIEKIEETEVLFFNKDESIEIISSLRENYEAKDLDNEKFLLKELKKLGAKIVAITDGKRGAWVSDGKETYYANGLEVDTIDTTGAGDAFSSGFLAACIKDKNLAECLQWGIVNSSSVVQFYGGTEGLLDESGMKDKVKDIRVQKI